MQGMLLCLPFTFAKVCCCVYLLLMPRYAAESDCRAFFTCAVYTNYHPRLSKGLIKTKQKLPIEMNYFAEMR